jgi:mono/diheme cytochrome c family protein
MRRDMMVLTTLLLTLAACDRPGTSSGAASASRFADYDAGSVPGGPGASARYGLGSAPVAAELARMNFDVGSDGSELPAGRGTSAEGAALYAAQCAMCHGQKGEGMAPAYPRLLGRDPKAEKFTFATDPKLPHTIGNYWPYATTLFDYIKRAMPHTAPGSLTDDQVYALSAFLLAEDDVIADSTVLDAETLRKVQMPYRDRFVPDDRKPGPSTK